MLRDQIRTLAYRHAVELNPKTFEGKSVLDIGCGTGILSVFCARAGAQEVTAVDKAQIAEYAKVICKPFPQVTVLRADISDLK